jgi:NADPH:quinone reductase
MKAILLKGPNDWEVSEIPQPVPGKGQVLVKMAFAPINPSDLSFLTGNYGLKKAFPVVPGLEGSGTVVSSGGGFLANSLKGKRVACTAPPTGNGTWAEYMLTDATKCIKLNEKVSLEQGSMLFVNPLTALSFSKQARRINADLIVFSAAGSALGKMVVQFAKEIPVLGIVRKPELIELLKKTGFHEVLSLNADNFLEELKKSTKGYKRVIYFDAVSGGQMPYKILKTLPENAKMVIYGRLDQTPAGFEPQDLLFNQNQIEGYWLSKEALKKSLLEIILDVRKVQKMLSSGFETHIQKVIQIEDMKSGLDAYVKDMSGGKVLLKFGSGH